LLSLNHFTVPVSVVMLSFLDELVVEVPQFSLVRASSIRMWKLMF
jgi:hypothetical protein